MQKLSNYKLKIRNEKELIRYRRFVCGEISRKEAYPTLSEAFIDGIIPLFYNLAIAQTTLSMILHDLGKPGLTFSELKKDKLI